MKMNLNHFLTLAMVALAFFSLETEQVRAEEGSSVSYLEFPPGVTLQTASDAQIQAAVRKAIAENPDKAKEIVVSSILALKEGDRLIPQVAPDKVIVVKWLVGVGTLVKTGEPLSVLELHGKLFKYQATASGRIHSILIRAGGISGGAHGLIIAVIEQSNLETATAIQSVIAAAMASVPPSELSSIIASAEEAASGNAVGNTTGNSQNNSQNPTVTVSPTPTPLPTPTPTPTPTPKPTPTPVSPSY